MIDIDGPVALLAIVGSHAYGTAREGSDTDYRGCYIAPAERMWHLQPPQETVDRKDPDLVVHELRKFCKLAAAANPNILETLYVDQYETLTSGGRLLVEHREAFLSRRVFKTYGGYALAQLQKAKAGRGGTRGQAHLKREKFILHLFRLLEQGVQLLDSGHLTVRVRNPEELWEKASLPLERVEREFLLLDAELRAAAKTTDLPDEPDIERINDVMTTLRWRQVLPHPRWREV